MPQSGRRREEPAALQSNTRHKTSALRSYTQAPSVIFLRKCHLPPGGRLMIVPDFRKNNFIIDSSRGRLRYYDYVIKSVLI